MLTKSFAALVAASFGLLCPQDPCPDQVTKTTQTQVVYGKDLDCGNIKIKMDVVTVGNGGVKGCPSFILITPSYDKTMHKKGSKTFTRPAGRVPVTRLEFTCATDWFIFFPIGSSCRQVSSTTIPGPVTYAQFSCFGFATAGVGG